MVMELVVPTKIGRRRKFRVIDANHSKVCFKPCGIKKIDLEIILINEDELESIRLADYEGMYQQEAANKMNISRTTFSRLVESARKKIAEAVLYQKALSIK